MEIDKNIEAYNKVRKELESEYLGAWVVFHDCKQIGIYATFEDAANDAVTKFGRDSYLIREIGAEPITLPASVMYRPVHG